MKKIILFLFMLYATDLYASLDGCLKTVSEGNQSFCYRQQDVIKAYRECPGNDIAWCETVKHRNRLEIEERKIEVLARLNQMKATNVDNEIAVNSSTSATNHNINSATAINSKEKNTRP